MRDKVETFPRQEKLKHQSLVAGGEGEAAKREEKKERSGCKTCHRLSFYLSFLPERQSLSFTASSSSPRLQSPVFFSQLPLITHSCVQSSSSAKISLGRLDTDPCFLTTTTTSRVPVLSEEMHVSCSEGPPSLLPEILDCNECLAMALSCAGQHWVCTHCHTHTHTHAPGHTFPQPSLTRTPKRRPTSSIKQRLGQQSECPCLSVLYSCTQKQGQESRKRRKRRAKRFLRTFFY